MPRKSKQQKVSAAIVQMVKRRKLTVESGLPDGWSMVDCTGDSADEFESGDCQDEEVMKVDAFFGWRMGKRSYFLKVKGH
jgi:hypothetical protein